MIKPSFPRLTDWTITGYEVLQPLGSVGMGEVWLAMERHLNARLRSSCSLRTSPAIRRELPGSSRKLEPLPHSVTRTSARSPRPENAGGTALHRDGVR